MCYGLCLGVFLLTLAVLALSDVFFPCRVTVYHAAETEKIKVIGEEKRGEEEKRREEKRREE